MTDTTISNLPAGAPAEPTDQIPIARGGANYSLTAQDIANLAGGGGGSPAAPAYGSATNAMQINNGSGAFGATNFYSSYINNANDFYTSLNYYNGVPQLFPWSSSSDGTIFEIVDPYYGTSNSLVTGYFDGTTWNAYQGFSIQSGTYSDGNNWVFDKINSYPSQLFIGSDLNNPALVFWTSSATGNSGETVPFVQSLAIDKDGGMFLGAATGGSQGVGTINATAYYVDGVPLTSAGYAPGGSTGAVQYNNANSFAGNANYTTDGNGNLSIIGESASLILGNPDQQTTQNPNLYVNGQNAAIWAQGQNARLWANDGAGVNFIEAGVNGLVVGLVAYTDAKGKGTVNAESYYVNGASIYSYGQFISEATQSVAEAATTQSITFTDSSGTADVTLVDNSKITFANVGSYLIAASVVTNDTVGGNALVYWLEQNGTTIANSATVCGQPIGGLLLTSACSYIVTTTVANEYIEFLMTGQATTNEITATPAGTIGACPLSPSIIVTVNRVG